MSLKDKIEKKPNQNKVESEGEQNKAVYTILSDRVLTVEDAVKKAGYDESIWKVERFVANSWEMGAKLPCGTIAITPLWQIKLWVERKAPQYVQDSVADIIENWIPPKLQLISHKNIGHHLAEISLYDAHFGKVYIGNEFESIEQQAIVFMHSAERCLRHLESFSVSEIIFPIGNDFFHVDNWASETHSGTIVESLPDRFTKVFRVGWETLEKVICRCREIAPVKVLWIPGNHDRQTSFYLAELLNARFMDDHYVTFDIDDSPYKFYLFGKTLLGYCHGDLAKFRSLPSLMANLQPEMWGQSRWRAWRTGHTHKKKQDVYCSGDTLGGVKIDVMPSLCKIDRWHLENGFVGNTPAAETWIWHKEHGYCGHFSEVIL